MPKGDKYIGLTNYLKGKIADSLIMSFNEIEKEIGDKLLYSAYKSNSILIPHVRWGINILFHLPCIIFILTPLCYNIIVLYFVVSMTLTDRRISHGSQLQEIMEITY